LHFKTVFLFALIRFPTNAFMASVNHSNLADPQPSGATLHSNFCPISFRR